MLVLVKKGAESKPGHSGTRARPPTLMKIFSASKASPPTTTRCGALKRACPQTTRSPGILLTQLATPSTEAWTIASLRALTARISTPTGPPTVTPKSAWRRATKAVCALAISALVGVQPSLTQVPPKCSRSAKATDIPAPVNRPASLPAADDDRVEALRHGSFWRTARPARRFARLARRLRRAHCPPLRRCRVLPIPSARFPEARARARPGPSAAATRRVAAAPGRRASGPGAALRRTLRRRARPIRFRIGPTRAAGPRVQSLAPRGPRAAAAADCPAY